MIFTAKRRKTSRIDSESVFITAQRRDTRLEEFSQATSEHRIEDDFQAQLSLMKVYRIKEDKEIFFERSHG